MHLLDMLEGSMSPAQTNQWGTSLGQTPDVSSRMAHHALPFLAAGFAHHGSTETGAARLLELSRQPAYAGTDTYSAWTADRSAGDGLLSTIFGSRHDEVTNAFATEYGYSPAHSRTLFSMMAPAVLAAIGRHARTSSYDARGLSSYFGSELPMLSSRLPARFSPYFAPTRPVSTVTRDVDRPIVHERRPIVAHRRAEPGRLLIPLLAIALIAGLAWYFLHDRHEDDRRQAAVTEPAERPATQPVGQGVDALAAYAASQDASVPRVFNLDDIRFQQGSDRIVAGQESVDKLANVLKDDDAMKIRIDGFADSAAQANDQLGQARASAVRDALVQKGVSQDRLDIGAGNAAGGAPSAGNARNRQLDVTVLSK